MASGWVAGTAGRRWQVSWQPAQTSAVQVRGTVLFLPPLGDEMNHARPLVAAAARRLAAVGWRVQCTDPHGTGDSAGDFAQASLAQWAEDFASDAAQAAAEGPWVLWVARQGALLLPALAEALARRGVPLPAAQAFWNPLWQGSAVVTQWLRVAALSGAAAAEGVGALRARLIAGVPVNCAGYPLAPALAGELEAVQAAPLAEVPARDWDVAALGARRFWLPHEEATDTTLVAPLLEWLDSVVPATGIVVEPSVASAVDGPVEAHSLPLCLEVPRGAAGKCGVLFVVGGPQYRVGAHRQFLLWSRRFNAAGHATCRFDRAGTGDAAGSRRALPDCGEELQAALNAAVTATGIRRWAVLGLCDGASLALLHLGTAPAVAGIVALNPWVPATPLVQSQALVREYYGRQWWSGAFWRRLLRGEVAVWSALREWWFHRMAAKTGTPPSDATVGVRGGTAGSTGSNLVEALLAGTAATTVPVLWALSGKDRTAAEFRACAAADSRWLAVLNRAPAETLELPDADHTLSAGADHDRFADAVVEWLTRAA